MSEKKINPVLEFLTVYGWAMLVVLAALGGLIYFNVINIYELNPKNTCGCDGCDFSFSGPNNDNYNSIDCCISAVWNEEEKECDKTYQQTKIFMDGHIETGEITWD